MFVPTDDAFAALTDGTVETLLKPENKDQLTKILTCYVVSANALSGVVKGMVDDVNNAHPVKTVGVREFTAMYNGDTVMIKDGNGNVANVT